ncbi:helix-turn-helix transcriptional regulator [Myroides odoratimimus]|uniref:helix-turn-helix transcriptional regulator n=1 Tax=Myroides odoratimimus TaxID=76832 RepID=UPI00091401F5|nr:helix-turn-helix domain-containing protein [Myroides odoratimimus]SHL57561.1 transcriptional regulator, AraC family [Myroides odoratimimus subsp. xuanwuensis]
MEIGIYHADLSQALYQKANSDVFKDSSNYAKELVTYIDHLETKGFYKEIHVGQIHIGYGDLSSKQCNTLLYQSTLEHVEMHFTLQGSSSSMANCLTRHELFSFSKNQHNILYAKEVDSIYTHDSSEFSFFEIKMTPAYFRQFLDDTIPLSNEFIKKMLRGEFAHFVKDNQLISLDMYRLIQEIIHCNRQGIYKRMFIESKVIELLLLQFEQFAELRDFKLNKKDIDNAYKVREYLETHLDSELSLVGLAHLVGTNEFTLKKSFKELFNTTVFGYWHTLKMTQAKVMLMDMNMQINEVTEAIGYKNARHFSTAFKKYFGISPSELY